MKNGFIILLHLLSTAFVAFSQPVGDIRFTRIDKEDGIPSSWINVIAQDREGFMWFATSDGLCKYDGYKVVTFRHDPADSLSLADNYVRSMHVDRKGRLWAGTYNGLSRFDKETHTFVNYLPEYFIRYISEDKQGVLWLGSDNGLVEYNPESGRKVVHTHQPKDSLSLSYNVVIATLFDSKGLLWIATDGGGLNRFDRSTGQFYHYKHQPNDPTSLSHNITLSIFEDSKQQLWVGTKKGLNKYDRRNDCFTVYTDLKYNIKDNVIFAMSEDAENALWIGSYSGLNRYDPVRNRFTFFTHNPVLQPV